MTQLQPKLISLGKLLLAAILPTLVAAVFRWLAGAGIDEFTLLRIWGWVVAILFVAPLCKPGINEDRNILFQPASLGIMIFILGTWIIYEISKNTLLAWLLLGGIYSLLLGWIIVFVSGLRLWARFFLEGAFAAAAGLLPALLNQIETRFSTEEFFVALEILGLMMFWLGLRGAFAWWGRMKSQDVRQIVWKVRRGWLLAGLGLAAFVGMIYVVCEYQRSFFPPEAPGFPGISAESPFICDEVTPSQETYQGEDVFAGLLAQVEANPAKSSPDYGFLALGTGDEKWADEFRDSLLSEAEAALFTEPSGSVKYGQYLASQRAYFYPLVRDAFTGLFTPSQEQYILNWFAEINQRTFTVEWVDWMYALAFRYWPQGPYENQENGAGLLSLLETNQLADPELSDQNQKYLAENPRGWLTRFRVTDDAAVYQPEWIENAWYQALYNHETDSANQNLSFEWLKVLALPDGSPLRYNHLGAAEYANRAFWGANLLGDETLLWLAGRALDYLAEHPSQLSSTPGTENPPGQIGRSPVIGSCLVYGDSGLPTQIGPLAPDKIVMRSGWEPDDMYLLLNLRFSGWHRYKATNSLVQIYQGEPLVVEDTTGENFDWLPTGRSIFRDKRIPRENLNGLQIGKSGLAAALYGITGVGGPWAQDPPYYAEATHFETSPEFTVSTTEIRDWHGWNHQRTIYFYPEGVVVVVDNAQGPQNVSAALTWHFVSEVPPKGNRIPLGSNSKTDPKAEVVLLPMDGGQVEIQNLSPNEDLPLLQAHYQTLENSHFQTTTIFLYNEWIGALAEADSRDVTIRQNERQIKVVLPEVLDE